MTNWIIAMAVVIFIVFLLIVAIAYGMKKEKNVEAELSLEILNVLKVHFKQKKKG